MRDYDVRIIDSVGHACTVHAGSQVDTAAGTLTLGVDALSRPQPAATGCVDCVALGLVVVVTATCEVLLLVAPVALLGCAGRVSSVGLACRAEHAVASKPCVLGTHKGGRSGCLGQGKADAASWSWWDVVCLVWRGPVRADQGQGQTMMFGHMVLLDCISGAVRFSMSTRLQACHPKVLDPPPSSCTSVLLDRFMVGLASWLSLLTFLPPPSPHGALGLVPPPLLPAFVPY